MKFYCFLFSAFKSSLSVELFSVKTITHLIDFAISIGVVSQALPSTIDPSGSVIWIGERAWEATNSSYTFRNFAHSLLRCSMNSGGGGCDFSLNWPLRIHKPFSAWKNRNELLRFFKLQKDKRSIWKMPWNISRPRKRRETSLPLTSQSNIEEIHRISSTNFP